MDRPCDLIKLERTNMISKMEDRIKIDLVAMGKQILDSLRPCEPRSLPHTLDLLNRIAVLFNQGALLQYQYGEIERAEALCRGEIELFAWLSSRSEHKALCLANMVPPYINLARIYGQKGEVQESLGIFEDLYRCSLQEQDLSVFGHRISIAKVPAICAAAPSYQKFMLSCRVVETARVLQTVEDYPALLELVETTKDLPEYQDAFFQQYLLEVRSRALLHMGHYENATDAVADCCRQMPLNSVDRISIHALLSQIYREWGRFDVASTTLDKLEDLFSKVEKFGRRLPVLRQIVYRLALERYALGDYSKALAPAERGYQWCSEWNDQPGSIKNAILPLRISSKDGSTYSPTAQRRWYHELQRLASTTFFRLERACAYWELGLFAELVNSDDEEACHSACELLQNSYKLYRSIPFVDSRQNREAVRRSLDARILGKLANGERASSTQKMHSPAIDSVFDALKGAFVVDLPAINRLAEL